MTDTVIDKLVVGISFDTKQLANSAKQVENTIGDMSKNIGDKLRAALDIFTTGFGLDMAKNLIEGFANTGANLQLLSQSIHENVSTLGTWQQAVIRVGGTAEGFNNTIKGLYDRINNAIVHGDPNTTGILSILGINPRANGQIKQTSVLLKEILERLHKQPERLRMQFGKQLGLDDATLRLANLSNKELDSLLKNMEKMGVVQEEQSKRALALKQSWQNVTQVWSMAAYDLADNLFPMLTKVGDWMAQHPKVIKDLTVAFVGLTGALVAFTALRTGVLALSAAFGLLRIGLTALTGPLGIILTLATGIYEIFQNRDLIKNWAKKEDLQWLVDLMTQIDNIGKSVSNTFSSSNLSNAWKSIKGSSVGRYGPNEHVGTVAHVMSAFQGGSKAVMDFVRNEKLAYAQMMKESSGRPGIVTYDSKGQPHVGLYQISPAYASKLLGRNVSIDELKNPQFNRDVRDKFLAEDLKLGNGSWAGALAWFNNGKKGYKDLLNSGRSSGGYAESVLSAAQKAPQNSTTNNSKNTHVSINTMQLHGMQNPRDFIQGLSDTTATGWTFSGARLA